MGGRFIVTGENHMTFTALAPFGRRHRPMRTLLLGTGLAALSGSAAFAETLTVTGITIPVAVPFTVGVPSVEVIDGNLDEATIRALFTGDAAALAALADLDAASVLIPEISVTTQMGTDASTASTTTYRNLRLENVVDGVAATAVVESTEATGAMGFAMQFGEMSLTQFDMAGMLNFYGFGPPSTSTEMEQVYADFHFEGGSFGAASMFNCTFGEMYGGAFNARPLKTTWSDAYGTINDLALAETTGKTPTPEQVRKVIDFYIDILTAFSNAPMTLDGVTCSGTDEKNQPVSLAFGPIEVGGFEPGIYPAFAVNDFDLAIPGHGSARLDNFTWKRMEFSAAIEALQHAASLDEAWFAANWRKLVPAMDGLSLAGLDFDLPDEQKPGERIKAKLGAFDATLGGYVNGLPTDIALTLDGLVAPITPDMTDPPLAELLAYGIKEITLGLGTSLHWDEASSTIVVDQLLVDAGELGRVAVSGTLGNATAALFGDDVEAATLAAQLLTVRTLTVDLEDRGIGPILFAAGAKDSGQPEASFRTAISGMAQGMTLAMLGNTDEALKAAQALGSFLAGSSELKLTLTSVDPAGLGLADFSKAESDPTALAGKFTVVAEAGGAATPIYLRSEPEPAPEPVPDAATPSIQEQKRDLKNSAPTQ